MSYIIEGILLILCWVSYVKNKKIYNPSTIFIGFWFIIIGLYNFHFFELLYASEKMLELICIGCVMFFLGTLLPITTKKSTNKTNKTNININVNNKWLKFLLLSAVVVLLHRIYVQIPYFRLGYSISEIRYLGIVDYGVLGAILFNFFALPFVDATIIILLTQNIYNDEKFKKYILPIFLIFLSMLSNGARLSIYQGVVVALFTSIVVNKWKFSYKIKIRKLGKIIFLISACLILIIFINSNRSMNKENNTLEGIYNYFCGSLVFSSEILKNEVDLSEFLYGVNSFGGILRPIYSFLGIIGIQESDSLYKAGIFMSESMQNYIVKINSKGTVMNYFCTCFIYMYKDGGVIALAIISFIYGVISNKFYKNLERQSNVVNLSLYNWIIYGFATSMMHFCFSNFIVVMELFYIFVLTVISSKKDKEKNLK